MVRVAEAKSGGYYQGVIATVVNICHVARNGCITGWFPDTVFGNINKHCILKSTPGFLVLF